MTPVEELFSNKIKEYEERLCLLEAIINQIYPGTLDKSREIVDHYNKENMNV